MFKKGKVFFTLPFFIYTIVKKLITKIINCVIKLIMIVICKQKNDVN